MLLALCQWNRLRSGTALLGDGGEKGGFGNACSLFVRRVGGRTESGWAAAGFSVLLPRGAGAARSSHRLSPVPAFVFTWPEGR